MAGDGSTLIFSLHMTGIALKFGACNHNRLETLPALRGTYSRRFSRTRKSVPQNPSSRISNARRNEVAGRDGVKVWGVVTAKIATTPRTTPHQSLCWNQAVLRRSFSCKGHHWKPGDAVIWEDQRDTSSEHEWSNNGGTHESHWHDHEPIRPNEAQLPNADIQGSMASPTGVEPAITSATLQERNGGILEKSEDAASGKGATSEPEQLRPETAEVPASSEDRLRKGYNLTASVAPLDQAEPGSLKAGGDVTVETPEKASSSGLKAVTEGLEAWGVQVVAEGGVAEVAVEAGVIDACEVVVAGKILHSGKLKGPPGTTVMVSNLENRDVVAELHTASRRVESSEAGYSSESDGEESGTEYPSSALGKRKGGLRKAKSFALKVAQGGVEAAKGGLEEAKSQALDTATWQELLTVTSLVALPLLVGAAIFFAVDHTLGEASAALPSAKAPPPPPNTPLVILGNWAPFLKDWLGPAAGAAGAAGTFAGLGIGLGASAKAAPLVAVLSARFVPEVETAWRTLGGASLVAIYWRTLVFGKTVRAVEWDLLSGAESPDGALRSVTIRQTSLKVLRSKIAAAHNLPGGAKDVQQMALWIPQGGDFFEPLRNSRDVALVPDYGYVAWTRVPQSQAAMPFRGGSKSRKSSTAESTAVTPPAESAPPKDTNKLLEELTAGPALLSHCPLPEKPSLVGERSLGEWISQSQRVDSKGSKARLEEEGDSQRDLNCRPISAQAPLCQPETPKEAELLSLVVAIAELAAASRGESIGQGLTGAEGSGSGGVGSWGKPLNGWESQGRYSDVSLSFGSMQDIAMAVGTGAEYGSLRAAAGLGEGLSWADGAMIEDGFGRSRRSGSNGALAASPTLENQGVRNDVADEHVLVTISEEDELIELALQSNRSLLSLFRAFYNRNPQKFLRHAVIHLRRTAMLSADK